MQAESEAAALEAAEADAKRELKRLEAQVNRGQGLDAAQLEKLEQLTARLDAGAEQADEADDHALVETAMPTTLAGMIRKLFEVNDLTDLLVILSLLGMAVLLIVVVTLPFGSLGFVYNLPHRIAHFFATGGLSGELFMVASLVLAWRAHKWQPFPALEWRDFGYAPQFMYLVSAVLIGMAAWMYITAEIELRKHGHGTLGSMAIKDGGYGVTRHPQYFSFPLFMGGIGVLTDSRWVFVMMVVVFIYCHSVLIPIEEAWLQQTHPELFAEHIKTGASRPFCQSKPPPTGNLQHLLWWCCDSSDVDPVRRRAIARKKYER